MGKSRTRKTRWRALDVADADRSDSEESNTNSSAISSRFNGSYHQTSARYYGRYSYSSQSTPRRKYQYDSSTKSTRSSSTTSETKITFNDDEYTRITTPRQDVLFKKGYLNKPKAYQTQTSTGNSTISTGNSTENGTPDHQSADLDYESQFVFPNGFVDQNGIYYVNSYDYPLMLFNPPTYYHEFLDSKAKRYSTGSLTESMSPNNEEATSQDLSQSGGETSNNVSDYAGQPLFNIVYPGYYVEGPCPPNDLTKNPLTPDPVKKLKKRRERKSSKTIPGESSDNSDEHSSDEAPAPNSRPAQAEKTEQTPKTDENIATDGRTKTEPPQQKYCLKPDAEEFVPRSYQNLPAAILPANFVPVPIVPLNEYGAPAGFIPPGIPINFVPHHPGQKIFHQPPFFPPPPSPQSPPQEVKHEEAQTQIEDKPSSSAGKEANQDKRKTAIDIETIVSKLEEAAKEQEEMSNGVEGVQKSYKTCPNFNRSPFKRNNYNGRYRDFQEPSVPTRNDQKPPVRKAWTPNQKYQNHQNGFVSPKRYPRTPGGKNYSEMVKKAPPAVTKPTTNTEKASTVGAPAKLSCNSINHGPNQWISVSSRKKKKGGKNAEEQQLEDAVDECAKDDEFEAYDVNMLEDVVPPNAEQNEEEETQIEEILTNLARNVASAASANVAMVEVSDIEKNMVAAPEPEPEPDEIAASSEEEARTKKKSKKSGPKAPTKKVIITDIDFSEAIEQSKPQLKTVKLEANEESKTNEPQDKIEEPAAVEKKSKKKKRNKTTKSEVKDHIPTPSKQQDEISYDFLMEESLLDESSDKTNFEVSLELDKLIQKGMYSNLKERIKSFNIDATDDAFFRTLRPSDKESTKTPDFNRIFQSTRQFLKPNSVSVEDENGRSRGDGINETLDPDVADGSASGSFLEVSGGGNLKTGDLNDIDANTPKDDESKKLYPITEAVKVWMSKTREATPEVELLKSPSTIIKEFGLEDDPRDHQPDLLDIWENDLPDVASCGSSSKCCEKCARHEIREGDEVIEVYESKYGQNDAYLDLRKRTKEEQKRHGNMPYRAICCSLQ